jgi:hypothetical protein
MATLTPEDLDALLTLQLSVAWAGESIDKRARHRWWQTMLVDEFGGLDLLERLLPETGKWAALEVVRRVARDSDDAARRTASDPDAVRSIFHLGFEIDEQLDDRLAQHKRSGVEPKVALPDLIGFDDEWEPGMWEAWLGARGISRATFTKEPGGRLVRGVDGSTPPLALVQTLVGALYEPSKDYPAPHVLG